MHFFTIHNGYGDTSRSLSVTVKKPIGRNYFCFHLLLLLMSTGQRGDSPRAGGTARIRATRPIHAGGSCNCTASGCFHDDGVVRPSSTALCWPVVMGDTAQPPDGGSAQATVPIRGSTNSTSADGPTCHEGVTMLSAHASALATDIHPHCHVMVMVVRQSDRGFGEFCTAAERRTETA